MKMGNGVLVLMLLGVLTGKAWGVEVFVSIPPQKWLVEQVGRDLVSVEVLVRSGQDPHTFEPLPKQVAALSKAKVWFTMGLEFEKSLIKKVQSVAPGLAIVDMSQEVNKLPVGDNDGEGHGTTHEADDGHPHEVNQAQHHHDEQYDPHVWLSPANLQVMGRTVAATLSTADQEHGDVYSANQAETAHLLTQLDGQLRATLAPYAGSSFFVFHPSFGYFAKSYGLVQEPVEVRGKSPGPKQLSALIARARERGVKVIFVQPQFDPKSAKAVAAAIGGNVVPLDALAEDVTGNLKEMAAKIEEALKQ